MSQYKQIAFLQAGEPVLQMVDLSCLSPQAKALAAAVNSTISYEDDSVVYIQSNQTNEQYWLEIAEHGDPHSFFSQCSGPAEIATTGSSEKANYGSIEKATTRILSYPLY